MIKYFLAVICLFLISCKTIKKKDEPTPPQISTGVLKESLLNTRTNLSNAGDLNNKISYQLDKAMSLAEQIDFILSKIEEEQSKPNFKTEIIKNP